jgi:3-hydroxyacyl-[acyl-carrier-protein] dehydratase
MTGGNMAEEQQRQKVTMDVLEIQKWLPHRYPFLLIDKILDIVPDSFIIAQKNVTINEQFFTGHFPQKPVMPGVLICEAMAQAAAVFARYSEPVLLKEKTLYLVGVDNFKWKKMVLPGDTLTITMRSVRKRNPLWVMDGEVTVDGVVVTTGTITAAAAA